MNLSPAYLKRREDWKEEGKQEGRQEGTLEERYSMIASLLEGRFGTLDSELSSLVERIAQLPISERTGLLLSLANSCRQYSHNRNIAETLAPIGKLSENHAHIYQTLPIAYLEKNAILSLIWHGITYDS
jgi:hypothetical protein